MRCRSTAALILLALSAGCVPKAPPPVGSRTPLVEPAPAPPPVVLGADWRDWPLTPGGWSYAQTADGSIASFGTPGAVPIMTLTCRRAERRVQLARATAAADQPATIRTSSTVRTLPAGPVATLAATDPLLDAMGFSRGRFVVEQSGTSPLVIPAWAEVERVTQDCRD